MPGRLLARDRAALPGERRRRSRTGRSEGMVALTSGTASYRLHTLRAEDFPRLPEVDRERELHAVDRGRVPRHGERVVRAASRDESRPVLTGVLVRFEGGKLDDGRDRLVPPGGASETRDRGRGARAARRSCRHARWPRSRGSPPAPASSSSACRRTRSSSASDGVLADGAPHRRPVPELPAAAARGLRARGDAAARASCSRSSAASSVLAQRNSPLRLRFAEGELTISAQTPDVGEARETLPAPFSGERSRSASTPSSCARASSRARRRGRAAS